MRFTVAEIVAAVDGRLVAGDANTVVDRVTQDSREAGPGTLFVPLVADRDGHDFIDAAITAGAVATLSDRPLFDRPVPAVEADAEADAEAAGKTAAVVEVSDTAVALTALGSAARARLDQGAEKAEVIGITGSVGKTTTKDLLASVLAVDRPTHASARSFNNEIGVPLTLLATPDGASVGQVVSTVVLEMGARGVGHIAELCAVGRPTVGLITTVGNAHTSEFGTVEAVAQAKGELIEALPADGLAVLNASAPLVAAMSERTGARVVMFAGAAGIGSPLGQAEPGLAVAAENVSLDDDLIPRFRLVSEWGSVDVVLGARGLHLVDNALAAAAVALALGLTPDQVAAGLATPTLSPMRMALTRTSTGAAIIDDSYNANPMSTEAALRSLAALPVTRRIAFLGIMAELGDEGPAEHTRIARLAADLDITLVAVNAPAYLITPADLAESAGLAESASQASVADIEEAAVWLEGETRLGPDDAVLVKGSRVARLERLVAHLIK